ncbi:MAG: SusF/SusE family outer membrane protein [Paludibacter sp.]|nr:SusF/SusE family outer membrane protein [Paludibacter sp.]
MRRSIKYLVISISLLIVGCNEEMKFFSLMSPPDTMKVTVSTDEIELNQDKRDSIALTFSWGDAANRGAGTELTYYLKVDVADNNFETAIPKIEIPAGLRSISFTHKELNDMLMGWNITSDKSTKLSAEVIAVVSKSNVYMKPEISTVDFNVTGYYVQSRDLYIVGSAVNGMDPEKALKMKEVISEKKYVWTGVLQSGDFKFIKDTTSLYPSYSRGASNLNLVYNTTGNNTETLFHIDNPGFYVITIDVEALTIEQDFPEAAYNQVWMIGDATPAGWNITNPIELQKDPTNQVAFVYTGTLNSGELKFPLENTGFFECDYFMPAIDQTGPDGDNRIEYVTISQAATHDYKWRISNVGIYKITLNVYDMTIKFEKQVSPQVPDDVPFKNIWIAGSATPESWNTPFSQNLTYDATATKGTFIWEGYLKAGEFKFPLSNTNGFECNYLMPTVVDSDNLAPLSQTDVSFVANGSPDKKWIVAQGEEGLYKISLNVINLTISFEKK